MSSLRRALILLAIVGFAAGAAGIAIILTSNHMSERGVWATFGGLIGWSFIGTGLYAWYRRPDNRSGALMTAVGFAWFVETLTFSDNRWVFAVGSAVGSMVFGVLAHLLVAFPDGRLETRFHRWLVASGYFCAVLLPVPVLLFNDTANSADCKGCPPNPLLVSANEDVYDVLRVGLNLAAAVVLVLVLREVVRRRRRASPGERAAYGPVTFVAGWVVLAFALVFLASVTAGSTVADILLLPAFLAFLAIPYAFLAGVIRSRLSRAGAVSELVEALGHTDDERRSLRDSIATALGDTSLTVAYWLPEQRAYVDAEGQRVELPEPGSGRVATSIERGGERLAAIVHDEALSEERDLVRAVGGAASLTLENERLAAELRARIEELRASRARIVSAADEERRRLERDLHDGAQQRLVALVLNLKLARNSDDPTAVRELLDDAIDELTEATAELRELARGIHPAILTDRGLDAAVNALASRATVPVEIQRVPDERLDAPVESTAYFVVAEALTNVARYSQASHAEVEIDRANGTLVVEVRDDGVGGADPGRGSGLRGLADRVAAVDGRLVVTSEPGGGTTVHAEIPCAQ
jgi:signal transduction histidine kinase